VNGRVVGLDIGRKRIGVAISDASRTLARPLVTLTAGGADPVDVVIQQIDRLAAEEDGVDHIVVGLPVRLDGSAGEETKYVAAFIRRLKTRTALSVIEEDERLSSREAESRLAVTERDWRKRKIHLDAAAAAVILQDYLDRQRPTSDEAFE
jgi:putative Holliday junction resolvase